MAAIKVIQSMVPPEEKEMYQHPELVLVDT
jgi:hypothetical protein